MQYDENAEKYGYEGEMTPIECDKLNVYHHELRHNEYAEVYLKYEVDKILVEKDKEIERLNTEIKEAVQTMKSQDVEIMGLKKKLENVQESMYADVVDANMENRRLKRALWLARAERADDRARIFYFNDLETMLDIDGYSYDSKKKKGHKKMTARDWRITWLKVERKCREKAKEYK